MIGFLQTVVYPTGAEWKILKGDFHSVLISETIDRWLKQLQIKLLLSAPYDHLRLVHTTFLSTPQDLLHRRWGHACEESIECMRNRSTSYVKRNFTQQ